MIFLEEQSTKNLAYFDLLADKHQEIHQPISNAILMCCITAWIDLKSEGGLWVEMCLGLLSSNMVKHRSCMYVKQTVVNKDVLTEGSAKYMG